VEDWRASRIPPKLDKAPTPSVAGESVLLESVLANIGTEEDYVSKQSAEGQSVFDWDHDGAKYATRDDFWMKLKTNLLL
jgi:hypothetical protein